jgi:hypothetical protein
MKACPGPGRRGPPQAGAASIGGISTIHKLSASLPQSVAGAWKQSFGEIAEPPAIAKEKYVPHDCKQYDFPSGALKSLPIFNMPVLWPSTHLEMIAIFLR